MSDEEDKRIEELKKKLENAINELPQDNPTKCEGLIRELHKNIFAVQKSDVKDHLLSELRNVACRGLEEDLRKRMEKNGLELEGLELVLKYLTTTKELAHHLFMASQEAVEEEGLGVIRRRLGPNLEVLGGLISKGIDVTQDWAKNLVDKAPSLQSLGRLSVGELKEHCQGATDGELEDVRCLVKVAESAGTPDKSEEEDNSRIRKAIDEEKLEKARALMNEAKEMAKQESEAAKKEVDEKIAEIAKILELPPDWNNQDIGKKPDELFEQLNKTIDEFDNAVEVSEGYKSDLEVVEKASGGRALCGIYHSKYGPPITAERHLIAMPAKVTLATPNNAQEIRYLKFSRSRAASKYVHTVRSSSTDVGFSVGGFYGLSVGNLHGGYASSNEEDQETSENKMTNSASVLHYIWIATKSFTIEQEEMKLSTSAKSMARSIVKDKDADKRKAAARHFMERYGSHLPAGLHTLGGVLFSIVDAESNSIKETTKLTEKAAQKLQGQISAGFLGGAFGIGASIRVEHSSSTGNASVQEEKEEDTSYTYSFQSVGPTATNPATFCKLLANNSTWALIDRGIPSAYIPVWELMKDLGSDEFHEAARILEDTWGEDEELRRRGSLISDNDPLRLSAALPAVKGSSLPESRFGKDERLEVHPMTSPPYKWICSLIIIAANGTEYFGSGFKIRLPNVDRTAIVTSGHCTYVDGKYATKITVQFPGKQAVDVRGNDIYAAPEYINSGSADHDFGLILLPERSDDGFGWSAIVPDVKLKNRLVTNCGYPGDKPRETMCIAGGEINDYTANRIFYMTDAKGGQSGSPVYTWYGGFWTVLAVHSYGGRPNSAARFTPEMVSRFLGHMNCLKRKSLRSVAFPNVYVRCDGKGVTDFNQHEGGTVNCQFKPPSGLEYFYIYPVEMTPLLAPPEDIYKVVIESVHFRHVHIRMVGMSQGSENGGGKVNCQFVTGPLGFFFLRQEKNGGFSFRSVQFPNCYLRLDGRKVNSWSARGDGTVNCQYYYHPYTAASPWESFYVEEH